MKKIIFIVAVLLAAATGHAQIVGSLKIPLDEPVPYQFIITVNLYNSPRTLMASEKVIQTVNKPYVDVDFTGYGIPMAGLTSPYIELVSHLLAGDNRVYLSDLGSVAAACADGTAYDRCSAAKPKFCQAGALVNKCVACGCPLGQVCAADGSCRSVVCGDMFCQAAAGETCATCVADCGTCPLPAVNLKGDGNDSLVIRSGLSVELSWTSSNVSTCTASGGWSGSKPLTGTEITPPITSEKTFYLSCTGIGGTASDNVTVAIASLPTTTRLTCRETTTVTQLLFCPPCPPGYATISCVPIFPLVFETTCTQDFQTICASVPTCSSGDVIVNDTCTTCGANGCELGETCSTCATDCGPCVLPVVDIKANGMENPTIAYGSQATLSWTSSNADSCAASGSWSGSKSLSGSELTPPVTSTQTYTLTCTGAGGVAVDSAVVNVAGTCIDGTAYSACSVTKPKYCDAGTLVDKASVCGCPSGYVASGDSCVLPTCADGTPYSACSASKPKYCLSGSLVNRASICGCPFGYVVNGDICTPVVPICADGTAYSSCSITKPKYCQDGALVDKASVCGCPSSYVASGDSCIVPTCTDGTASGACSATKPKYCDAGTLVDKASVCGCPAGYAVSGDACVVVCSDGTLEGACSATKPLRCEGGGLVSRASVCGCPAGYAASGDNCVLPGWNALTCRSNDWQYIETMCVSSCDDDCENAYDPVYGAGNVKSVGGSACHWVFFFIPDKWNCHCYAKPAQTVSCSSSPSCPSGYNVEISTPCSPACADGTASGACSLTKPKYCQDGALVDKASVCGCPPNYAQQGDNCVKKAVLLASITRGPTCTPEDPSHFVTPPEGASEYYYNTRISETNSVAVTFTQRYRNFGPCGSYTSVDEYKDGNYLLTVFGSNTIPAGGSFTFQDEAVYIFCTPVTLTETYSGTDANGNSVSTTFTSTLTGCGP